jgi:hypothetical protein
MKTVMITLAAVLFFAVPPANCQSLDNPTARKVADVASWATMGANVALQTAEALHCPDKTACLLRESVQIASVVGSVFAIKQMTDSPRPCATFTVDPCTGDNANQNVPSGHTALAVQAATEGDHIPLKLTLAGATAALRLLSGNHDWKGVTSGAGVGFAWTLVW